MHDGVLTMNCIILISTVASHTTLLHARLKNATKPNFVMEVTSEWNMDRLFHGDAAKMSEERVLSVLLFLALVKSLLTTTSYMPQVKGES